MKKSDNGEGCISECAIDIVTIIVPVHNTSKDLMEKCISSIVEQSYNNIELVIVDDGSDDNCAKLCENYVKNCKNKLFDSKVYHLPKVGVSAARNYGIDNAKGKYLCFVDSDDYLHKDYVKKMLQVAQQTKAPFVACQFKEVKSRDSLSKNEEEKEEINLYTKQDVWKHVNTGYIWNKLYDIKAIGKIRFKEDMQMCEDFVFVNTIFDKNPICATISSELYYHTINPFSLTSMLNSLLYQQAIKAWKIGLDISYVKNNQQMYNARLKYLGIWYLKYMEAIVAEGEFDWKKKFVLVKKEFLSEIAPVVNRRGSKFLYTSTQILKCSDIISIIYFRILRIFRIFRLNLKRLVWRNRT